MRLPFALLIVLAAAVQAADEPAAGDAISAAKRDFDTIRAARDKTQLPAAELPRISVPEIQFPSASPTKSRKVTEEELQKKKKSANWLLEAMTRQANEDQKAEGKPEEKPDEFARLLLGPREPGPVSLMVVPEEPKVPEIEPRKIEAAANPLNQFLEGWMTPQDYALLKPALEPTDGLPTAGVAASSPSTLPGSTIEIKGAAMGDSPGLFAGGDLGMLSAPKPAENPYLQLMNEPAPFIAFTPPLPPTVAAPIPSRTPTFTPPPPPPAPKVPDFVRPIADDKYFKPLKRF